MAETSLQDFNSKNSQNSLQITKGIFSSVTNEDILNINQDTFL
ncbi:34159_t:CDS:2 [Gigaspora margarita]|uniref:34159_t:CDS:1 n=1 Tax=Gigaspora margarita TaxID=4874 RepID=A0ABN7UNX3_GIGMA|nr:34159_t:CDS:2 [Gigaspora margarita]